MARKRTALVPGDDLRLETYIELVRTYEVLAARLRETFKGRGLTPQQYNVLRILYVRDQARAGLSCQEIRDRLVHRVPDITRLVDRLAAAGWVTRERSSEDRRVVLTSLTDTGHDEVEGIHPELMARHQELFSEVSDADLRRLRRLLVKVREVPGA